jgi:hypothetical protein
MASGWNESVRPIRAEPYAAPSLITGGEFAQAFPLLIRCREILAKEKDAFVFIYRETNKNASL